MHCFGTSKLEFAQLYLTSFCSGNKRQNTPQNTQPKKYTAKKTPICFHSTFATKIYLTFSQNKHHYQKNVLQHLWVSVLIGYMNEKKRRAGRSRGDNERECPIFSLVQFCVTFKYLEIDRSGMHASSIIPFAF